MMSGISKASALLLLVLLCLASFLPKATTQACASTEELLKKRCSASAKLWNVPGEALDLVDTSTASFARQIKGYTNTLRSLACEAVIQFKSCIETLNAICPPNNASVKEVESLLHNVSRYVYSPTYRQQCIQGAHCGPNQFSCLVYGVSGCINSSLVCDRMSHCDDGLDESVCGNTTRCDIQAVSNCLTSLKSTFPTIHPIIGVQLLLSNQTGQLTKACTAYSQFFTCFDLGGIKRQCSSSSEQSVQLALALADNANQNNYHRYCDKILWCENRAMAYCLPILESQRTVRLGIRSTFSSQIQVLSGEQQNTACNLVVAFSQCIESFKSCSNQSHEVENMRSQLQAYFPSIPYKSQCLKNVTCSVDTIPCRVAWLGLTCVSNVCDGVIDCHDEQDILFCKKADSCEVNSLQECLSVWKNATKLQKPEELINSLRSAEKPIFCETVSTVALCANPLLKNCQNETNDVAQFARRVKETHESDTYIKTCFSEEEFCNLTRVSICAEQYLSTQVLASDSPHQSAKFFKCLGQCSVSNCDLKVVPEPLAHVVSSIQASEQQFCEALQAESTPASLAAATAESSTCLVLLTVFHFVLQY